MISRSIKLTVSPDRATSSSSSQPLDNSTYPKPARLPLIMASLYPDAELHSLSKPSRYHQ